MIFRVTHAFRHRLLGHVALLPGDYTEAQLTARYPGLPQDLIANRRGDWLDAEGVELVSVEVVAVTNDEATIELVAGEDDVKESEWKATYLTDYSAMSVDELTAYAVSLGIYDDIEGSGANGNILKADLVAAFEDRS